MARFFSYPGSRPPQPEGSRRRFDPQAVIDSPLGQRQLGEWFASRAEHSHLEVGLQRGEKVHFRDAAGEDRPAIVEGEERDSHTGKVDVWLRADDARGSGSYRMTFEGDTARSLKSSVTKRVHE